MNNPGVINLSPRVLTPSRISLLGKGLKFCPTPPMLDPGILRTDLDGLHRRLRLISYFKDNEISSTPAAMDEDSLNLLSNKPFKHQKFKPESTWWGPEGP